MKVSAAKTKVCPFMGEVAKFGNPGSGACICSGCMAWEYTRTTQEDEIVELQYHDYGKLKSGDKSKITGNHKKVSDYTHGECFEFTDERWAIIRESQEDEKEGYCQRLQNDSL